jgi:hypothetical protein
MRKTSEAADYVAAPLGILWARRRRFQQENARRIALHRQEIDRFFDLNHATNLTKIETAFAALGKKPDIFVVEAG